MKKFVSTFLMFAVAAGASAQIALEPISRVGSGVDGGAEIVDFDPESKRMLVANGGDNTIDLFDLTDPDNPVDLGSVDMSPYGDGINSVAVKNGLVAAAVKADPATDPGKVVFLDIDGNYISDVTVGALPDMVTFTPNGRRVLVANEGEPNDDYTVDPEGSVSIIRVGRGAANPRVRTVSFAWLNPFKNYLRSRGVRIFGPGASVAQDLEPEYIATSPSGNFAWVTCQENNCVALISVRYGYVISLLPLGTKSHLDVGNKLDASNRDDEINIQRWPTKGMYQPDAIDAAVINGGLYFFTANEGDARDYDGFSEEARVDDLNLAPWFEQVFPGLQEDGNLGRLKTTTEPPSGKQVIGGEEVYTEIHSYGARSFSIWSAFGTQVFDSGDEFETYIATHFPEEHNSQGDGDSFDNRSDDKGPEPEAIVVGEVGGRSYAFTALERVGGIMVYDVSVPELSRFVAYAKNLEFVDGSGATTADDIAPEGLKFVAAEDSPNGVALLLVASEVSGTTTVYQVVSTEVGEE